VSLRTMRIKKLTNGIACWDWVPCAHSIFLSRYFLLDHGILHLYCVEKCSPWTHCIKAPDSSL
jgi:hypothetical protein